MKSATLTALLLILFLAGCGQSGPLYVPGDPSSTKAPAEQPASDEDKEKDENSEGSSSQ